jgi:hypothetical protein
LTVDDGTGETVDVCAATRSDYLDLVDGMKEER